MLDKDAIYNTDGTICDNPDDTTGWIDMQDVPVTHEYVVDSKELGHWETVKEYPETGGKIVEWRVDAAEQGHWRTTTAEGESVSGFQVPDDWPREQAIFSVWHKRVYTPYTDEELAQYEQQHAEAQATSARTAQLEAATMLCVRTFAASFADEQLLSISMLFPDWEVGGVYAEDDIVRYAGQLYRALQASTGEAHNPPDAFTSGWKRIGDPDPSGIFPWVQPLGATDAYPIGDKVTHNGKTWVSVCDSNVWEPGVYGWNELTEVSA